MKLLQFITKIITGSRKVSALCLLTSFYPTINVYVYYLHINGGDFEGDGFKFGEEVQVHEVLLTEQTRPLAAPINGRSLQNKQIIRNTVYKKRINKEEKSRP